MRLANRQRQDQVAAEVYGLSLTTDHIEALHVVFSLPDNADPDMALESPETLKAAHLLENHFEYWGILVFQRVIDLHTPDRMIGGVVRASWRKLQPYIECQRQQQNVPNMAEWFQWLADRLEKFPAPGKEAGAHISQRDWQP